MRWCFLFILVFPLIGHSYAEPMNTVESQIKSDFVTKSLEQLISIKETRSNDLRKTVTTIELTVEDTGEKFGLEIKYADGLPFVLILYDINNPTRPTIVMEDLAHTFFALNWRTSQLANEYMTETGRSIIEKSANKQLQIIGEKIINHSKVWSHDVKAEKIAELNSIIKQGNQERGTTTATNVLYAGALLGLGTVILYASQFPNLQLNELALAVGSAAAVYVSAVIYIHDSIKEYFKTSHMIKSFQATLAELNQQDHMKSEGITRLENIFKGLAVDANAVACNTFFK